MIALTPRRTLLLGAALILVINAIVLAGIAWNRGGEPESMLRLTGRELVYQGWQVHDGEDSSRAMMLEIQALTERGASRGGYLDYVDGREIGPVWLDNAKLAALGLDVSLPPAQDHYANRYPADNRECFLVLELAGPAWQRARELARAEAARVDALPPRDPEADSKERESAHERVSNLDDKDSRLFVVDAALDAESLRAKYRDRRQYAIVRGRVLARRVYDDKAWRVVGAIGGLEINVLHVPRQFHAVLADWAALDMKTRDPSQLVADVSFGRRLEPWLTALSLQAAAPDQTRE